MSFSPRCGGPLLTAAPQAARVGYDAAFATPESPMVLLFALACAAPPEGLGLTPDGDGPLVRVDFDAWPLADIPYPNDMATRADPTSPTGRRLNVETHTDTRVEEEARLRINRLTGFGVYAPISVGFEGRLDLDNLLARHRDDPRYGPARLDDDAVLVIDVDPQSPGYLQPVELDLGEGRFPMEAARPDRYFTNDSRASDPSLVFDTTDEDLNGNGALDWGEDTDNDGHLDSPNVWPPGGDPVDDLLTWYELESDTLLMRPVVPLREQTTYAVVLTTRLTDAQGQPVRSPWQYVHHLAQTQDLRALEDALPALGLGLDEVAFAWTFTTGAQTQDLVDIQRGLHGAGPFSWLAEQYPAAVGEAGRMHSLPGVEDGYRLPVVELMDTLVDLGLFDPDEAGPIVDNYQNFAAWVVGGVFTTPYFLVDRDGDADHDEAFELDPFTGEAVVAPQRVPFTCVLPAPVAGASAPYPVAIFGHGYGSSRFDLLGFAHAFSRMGIAACAMDFPGHGPSIDPEEAELIEAVLGTRGLSEFLTHLQDSRYRDLNNDGVPDSGGDQWSADAFHTRDMVRQAAVDWMWMVEALNRCGEGTMTLADGSTRVSCDWDDDGQPDLGAGQPISILGGSLGGINAAVAAPVIPDVTAWSPIVPGAGLVDVGMRTEIGGAVEAMVGRLLSPLFVGVPVEGGQVQVVQITNSVTDMVSTVVATVDALPLGGRVVVENLDKGLSHEGYIPLDGRFRVGIAADALDGPEKAVFTGMAELSGIETAQVEGNAGLGDRLRVSFYDAGGALVQTVDTFEAAVLHEGVSYPAGSPLVALNEGLGHIRATPEMHRVARAFAGILEPGDPVAYAPYYLTGHPELGGEPLNVLVIPSIGDTIVPVATGVALARSAGLLVRDEADPRWGLSEDQYLVDRGVVQGLEQYGPYTDSSGAAMLFDPDDLDDGVNVYGEPSDTPLRATVQTSAGVSALRLPYVRPTGTHGFGLPEPDLSFDINIFMVFQVASYFDAAGLELSDDPCLADASCPWIPPLPEEE